MRKIHTALLSAAVLAFAVPAFTANADASIITYDFSITANAGPLSGITANGSFSYDSASITPGTSNLATGLLTALNFTWNGITYNAGTANTGGMYFDKSSNLTEIFFGTNCTAGSCGASNYTNQWWLNAGPGIGDEFSYGTPTSLQTFAELPYSLTRVPATVPEPGSLALLGTGLLGLTFIRRRKRA